MSVPHPARGHTEPENSPLCMKAIHRVGLASESLNKGHYLEKEKKQKMGLTCINILICTPFYKGSGRQIFVPRLEIMSSGRKYVLPRFRSHLFVCFYFVS